ncbi:MAG: lamin tail domain-containing protein [Myxococcota bacterium]
MDLVAADDGAPWPVASGGHTLVKADPDAPSDAFESWRASPTVGGTPGAALPRAADPQTLVASDASWRFDGSGVEPAGWPTPVDTAWPVAPAPFNGGGGGSGTATVRVTADNHFAVYLGAEDGSNLRLVGRDGNGDWTSAEDFAVTAAADDHLYLAGWEGPGDSGSPQMIIGEVERADGSRLGTSIDAFDAVLGPDDANPGDALGAAAPAVSAVAALIAAADAGRGAAGFQAPAVEAPNSDAPWGGALGGAFSDARFIWIDTFAAASATNAHETYALFRSRDPIVGVAGTALEPIPTTAYFRTTFSFAGDPATTRLVMMLAADDAAAVYLNGALVHRQNLPAGALDADVLALAPVAPGAAASVVALPSDHLVVGPNVIAVEVHQAADPDATLHFELSLVASPLPAPPIADDEGDPAADLVINEIMYHGIAAATAPGSPPAPAPSDWLELFNRGTAAIDLGGWQLVDGVEASFAAGTVIAPQGYLVVAQDAVAFAADHPGVPVAAELSGGLGNGGERIALIDACGRVVDAVRYSDGGRWPEWPDGGGSSLELRSPWADDAVPEAWAASGERARAAWQTVTYRGVATASAVGPDGQWEELVLGLLDAGEVLLDDIHVIEDPDGARIELVQNPGFDGDSAAHWRFLGTHAASHVTRDPDAPQNPVLDLVASGATEHMHNQVVQTLAGGRKLVNGRTYQVSYRARWVGGDDQLNSRLYFNRLARTTRLGRPSAGGTPGRANSTLVADAGPTFRALAHAPVVPRAGEPVVVSLRAADPDGIDHVTLWTSVAGAAWSSTPMSLVDGDARGATFEASLPGQPLGTLVQLYVEGVDARGAAATFPALGPASRAMYKVDSPRGANAPGAGLHTLRILMAPDDDAAFHAPTNVMSNASTRVTVVYDERRVFYDIGVRAKGSERARDQQARLGWSLRFDDDDLLRGAFDGVSLDRSEGVITGEREILMDQVMAHAGIVSAEYNDLVYVMSPRSEHTGPAIMQTSRFSNTMLENQFQKGGDGRMYEYELVYFPVSTVDGTPEGLKLPEPDGVIGTALRDLGDDPESYRWSFLVKNNRDDDDFSALMAMLKTWSLDDTAFAAQIESVADVDEWLRAFAFMGLSGAVDHYGGGAQHNAQLYVRPSDGRALLFPHDLDFYPGDPRTPLIQSGDLQRLLRIPGNKRRFYAHVYDILQSTYNATYLAHWRDQLAALLPGQPFASHYQFMVDRAQYVLDDAGDGVRQAMPAVAFAITSHGGQPFVAPAGVVTLSGTGWVDVRAIAWDGDLVDVAWTDDSHWQVARPLTAGVHTVTLEARDALGAVVGTDSVTITVTP